MARKTQMLTDLLNCTKEELDTIVERLTNKKKLDTEELDLLRSKYGNNLDEIKEDWPREKAPKYGFIMTKLKCELDILREEQKEHENTRNIPRKHDDITQALINEHLRPALKKINPLDIPILKFVLGDNYENIIDNYPSDKEVSAINLELFFRRLIRDNKNAYDTYLKSIREQTTVREEPEKVIEEQKEKVEPETIEKQCITIPDRILGFALSFIEEKKREYLSSKIPVLKTLYPIDAEVTVDNVTRFLNEAYDMYNRQEKRQQIASNVQEQIPTPVKKEEPTEFEKLLVRGKLYLRKGNINYYGFSYNTIESALKSFGLKESILLITRIGEILRDYPKGSPLSPNDLKVYLGIKKRELLKNMPSDEDLKNLADEVFGKEDESEKLTLPIQTTQTVEEQSDDKSSRDVYSITSVNKGNGRPATPFSNRHIKPFDKRELDLNEVPQTQVSIEEKYKNIIKFIKDNPLPKEIYTNLSEREILIVRLFFGLDPDIPNMKAQEIAKILNGSLEEIESVVSKFGDRFIKEINDPNKLLIQRKPN